MSVHDFTAAATARAKARCASGETVMLPAGSAVLAQLRNDPGVAILDLDWISDILSRMPPRHLLTLLALATDDCLSAGDDPMSDRFLIYADRIMRSAERAGELHILTGGN
ncbi:hypothetical protein OF001_U20358 [Pseudomonas sp. OF001]|uniref:hypothetical protein n=1 Tax=Pseudomonas sp. OF001 TaxID=2772300 RepID=UPI001918C395|nr:hypothetical protein [Pseudomonas sp. OF001]CAD5377431.1 hypothetical protein OF001_U20358 [Pseudomonas sp. OF001]